MNIIAPSHGDSKKFKFFQYLVLTVVAFAIVFLVAKELGWVTISASVDGLQQVNPQSMEIAKNLCAEEGPVASVQVLSGMKEFANKYTTDTVICRFTTGESMPFMLIYDQMGVFVDYL